MLKESLVYFVNHNTATFYPETEAAIGRAINIKTE